MTDAPGQEPQVEVTEKEPQSEQRKLRKISKRVWIINIVFFLILFGGMFLVPFSGIYVAAAVILVAFVASMLYIYLF